MLCELAIVMNKSRLDETILRRCRGCGLDISFPFKANTVYPSTYFQSIHQVFSPAIRPTRVDG